MYTVIYGEQAGELTDVIVPYIWPIAIVTITVGTIGALSNPSLRGMAGNLVIVSIGTLLLAFALRTPEATAAAFYYLIHSTLATAVLFLVADMIGLQRGKAVDRFVVTRKLRNQVFLGICFFITAMAVAGLPPFSGFLGKLVVLQAAVTNNEKALVYASLLISSLVTIVAFSRAGTTIFMRHAPTKDVSDSPGISRWQFVGTLFLLGAIPMLSLAGASILSLTEQAASQLHNVQNIIEIMGLVRGEP